MNSLSSHAPQSVRNLIYYKNEKTIAFDFLGVLVKHDGNAFISVENYFKDEPNTEVVDAIKILRLNGFKVIIHSTLADELVEKYCTQHNIEIDEINKNSDYQNGNNGKPVAHAYVDDRAIQYKGQDANSLAEQIINFQPYWRSE